MSESDLMRKIQISLAKMGVHLFRNQVGTYELKSGIWLSSGLCVGSSDLIGWTQVKITPAMVGHSIPIFTAIEVKFGNGKPTPEQIRFIEAVRAAGGIASVVRSVEESEDLFK